MTEAEISPALGLYRLLDDSGRLAQAPRIPIADELGPILYRQMRRLRRLDERMMLLQRQGRIGFYGACTGQEAPPVAAALSARDTDWIFPALRESGALLARGFGLDALIAQLEGSSRDLGKGRQMPSHAFSREKRVVSWGTAVSTQLPQAVGAAMAARRKGSSDVMLAFCGEGATSHPDFHAALNLAGVFRAQVVFVCQNNQYAISLPAGRQTASATFAIKAQAYGIAGERVDGNDALAVHDAISVALERARQGDGATLLECVTYRLGAHSSSDDPSVYRSQAEESSWRALDPIERLGRHLSFGGRPADPTLIDHEMDAEIDQVLAGAGAGPPPVSTLFDDVYQVAPWHLLEQRQIALRARSSGERTAPGHPA